MYQEESYIQEGVTPPIVDTEASQVKKKEPSSLLKSQCMGPLEKERNLSRCCACLNSGAVHSTF
jgi:hypothetical protein